MQDALATAKQQQTQQQQTAAPASTPYSGPIGLAALASRKRGIAPGGGSALAKAMFAKFQEIITANDDSHLAVHLLDSAMSGTLLSAVILTHHSDSKHTATAYHTIIINNRVPLPVREVTHNGHRMEIPSVPGDVYGRSQLFRTKVKDLVKSSGATVAANTGCTVIPVDIDVSDEVIYSNILHRAAEATQNKLEALAGVPGQFSLTHASPTDVVMGTLNQTDTTVTDILGAPIRSDVSITVQVTDGQSQDQYNANTTVLSRADVLIDLMPRVRQSHNQFMNAVPANPDLLHYDPRVVIQATNTMNNSISLEQILLAIHSTSLLTFNGSWMTAFRPSKSLKSKAVDLRDIGAIGYEVNLTGVEGATPAPIETKSAKFEPSIENGDPLVQLLSAVVSPDLVYSMDIPQSGEISWMLKVFTTAALAGHGQSSKAANAHAKARAVIISKANNLTGNRFSQFFPENAEICILEEAPIHVGHYMAKGVKRPVSDLDYLAMLAVTGQHGTATAHRYASTFAQTNVPWPNRLAARLSIMNEVLPSLEISDYANRVTFTPEFLTALGNAIKGAGLVLTPQNLYQETAGMFTPLNLSQYAVQSSSIQQHQPAAYGGATVYPGSALI